MAKSTPARDILWPTDSSILVRTAILHVGQGASALVFVRDGSGYKTLLVDINLDAGADGIDVRSLVEDLVGDDGLDVFVNTHPHDDHLRGIKELSDRVDIRAIWHSGHTPSKRYGSTYYDELVPVIKKVRRAHGANAEVVLIGSKEEQTLGDGRYYVLSPAKYVTDDVNDETPQTRRNRIHEQCGVLKFGTVGAWSMIVGDADRNAFEKHIQEYHKERLPAKFLAASHHGSRTFFCDEEGDDPYEDALDSIDPDYVVVSAPRQKESRHCHPHDDAMKIYRKKVGKDNVLHTGADRYSFICDIYADGTDGGVADDMGELAERYPLEDDDGGGNGKAKSNGAKVAAVSSTTRTRIDDRPMGAAC